MSGFTLGLIATLADVAPDPVGISGGRLGMFVAGLAAAVAIALVGVILVRRRGGKGVK